MLSEFVETFLQVFHVRKPIYETVFAPLASPYNASLLYALAYTSLMLFIAWVMYRRKIFVKI
jgi:predicted acyltransferase